MKNRQKIIIIACVGLALIAVGIILALKNGNTNSNKDKDNEKEKTENLPKEEERVTINDIQSFYGTYKTDNNHTLIFSIHDKDSIYVYYDKKDSFFVDSVEGNVLKGSSDTYEATLVKTNNGLRSKIKNLETNETIEDEYQIYTDSANGWYIKDYLNVYATDLDDGYISLFVENNKDEIYFFSTFTKIDENAYTNNLGNISFTVEENNLVFSAMGYEFLNGTFRKIY